MNKIVKEQLDRYNKFCIDLFKICKFDDKQKTEIIDLISKYELALVNDFEIRNKIHKEVDLDFLRQDILSYLEEKKLDRYANITKDDWKNLDYYELESTLDDIADKRDEYRMNDMSINEILDMYQKYEIEEEVEDIKKFTKEDNEKAEKQLKNDGIDKYFENKDIFNNNDNENISLTDQWLKEYVNMYILQYDEFNDIVKNLDEKKYKKLENKVFSILKIDESFWNDIDDHISNNIYCALEELKFDVKDMKNDVSNFENTGMSEKDIKNLTKNEMDSLGIND